MFATALALAMVGGWGAGSPTPCASPALPINAPRMQAAYPVQRPVLARPAREWQWHSIRHEGLVFTVWGYFDAGAFAWYPDDANNAASFNKAKDASKPVADVKPAIDINQTGIDRSKFLPRSNAYTAASDEAKRFVGELNSVEADTSKIHVTVIGEEDDCKPVIDDLNNPSGPFAAMRSQLHVQGYRAKEWQVDPGLGFPIHGHPAILVQSAKGPLDPVGGKVIYRADDYSMGPQGLAEAIRKVNPNYKPQDDPGPATGKADGNLVAFVAANPIFLASAVAFVILLLISPKRKDG